MFTNTIVGECSRGLYTSIMKPVVQINKFDETGYMVSVDGTTTRDRQYVG